MSGERTRYYQIRPRRIPPEFSTDELLEDCSVLAALLLYRIVSLADDQGRLPGHPRSVRANAFPLRPAISQRKVAAAIDELVRAGFVIRYDIAGRTYLQVAGWFDMQGKWAQRRTYPSRYPAPPGWNHDWVNAGDAGEVHAIDAQQARDVRTPLPAPSSASFSSAFAPSGRVEAETARSSPERVGELLDRAAKGTLSDSEALELGSIIAREETSSEKSRT